MRQLFAATTICLALASVNTAKAQTPGTRDYDESSLATPTRMSLSQQHLYQRASYAARERTLRLEANKWHGYSPLRPNYYPTDINALTLGRGPWDCYHVSAPYGARWYYRGW